MAGFAIILTAPPISSLSYCSPCLAQAPSPYISLKEAIGFQAEIISLSNDKYPYSNVRRNIASHHGRRNAGLSSHSSM